MKKRTCLFPVFFLFLAVFSVMGQTVDDNVVITECEDTYTFTLKDGVPIVRNRKETVYEASRMEATVQPAAVYGEFITLDGASGKGEAQYKSITPENIFFDDTKVCFFNVRLDRKGKATKAAFKRTFQDLRYLTRIYLPEEYFVRNKRVTFIIPSSLARFQLREMNFTSGITCERTVNAAGDSVFAYRIQDMPGLKEEGGMPSGSRVYPHLLVTGSFKDYHDLYRWSNGLAQVDCTIPGLETLLDEITTGCRTELERVRNTYMWVQRNIRYVAFEAGIAGHRPDRPSEVLRKRYGDCKGMALLLCTLLKAQGFDARLTDIGTDNIPYRITDVPTLATADHMICTLFLDGKSYYLDATNEFIPLEAVPGNIQGRQALVENGAVCLVETLPVLPATCSTDRMSYDCSLLQQRDGSYALQGNVCRNWSGDMKELFLTTWHNSVKNRRQEVAIQALTGTGSHFRCDSVRWRQDSPQAQEAILSGTIAFYNKVQVVDGELYIDLNLRTDPFAQLVDTTKRVHDYELPFRCHIVRETLFRLPEGMHVSHLPEGIELHTRQGTLSCTYEWVGKDIRFRKRMTVEDRRIPREQIPAWNEALRQWAEACNEQVVLTSNCVTQ